MIPKPGQWAQEIEARMGPQLGVAMWVDRNIGQTTASGNTVLAPAGIGEVHGTADPTMAAEDYITASLSAAWEL